MCLLKYDLFSSSTDHLLCIRWSWDVGTLPQITLSATMHILMAKCCLLTEQQFFHCINTHFNVQCRFLDFNFMLLCCCYAFLCCFVFIKWRDGQIHSIIFEKHCDVWSHLILYQHFVVFHLVCSLRFNSLCKKNIFWNWKFECSLKQYGIYCIIN